MAGFFGHPLKSPPADEEKSQAKIGNIHDFFKTVQDRTGMFCKIIEDHGSEQRIPYQLYPQQLAWLDLFHPRHVKRRALLASRDKGKSQIVTILGSAWQIYQDRSIKIGIMSFKHANAAKLLNRSVEILEAMGVGIRHTNDGWYTGENKDHTPSLMAMGLNTTVRGMHFDYLIMDDPLTVNEQFSAKYIARSRYFVNEGSSIARRIILIGQLLTRNDLYYDAYGNTGNAYYVLQSWHGDIPQLDKDLDYETRSMGKKDVARNYLGYIDDNEEAIFQGIQFDDARPQGDVYACIDPSAKGRDYTAVAIGWVVHARLVIYGKIYKKHWGDCLDEITVLTKNCKIVYYEDNQGRALGRFLKERGVRNVGVTSTANKIAKIYGLRGLIQMDRLRLSNSMEADAIMQIKNWTETAEHDDLPDAIAMLVHKMGWKIK